MVLNRGQIVFEFGRASTSSRARKIARFFHPSGVLCLLAAGVCVAGCGNTSGPSIHSLSPQRVTAGGSNFFLNVFGSGFAPGSVVLVDGAARTTAFVSDTQLSVLILAKDVAQPTERMLQVSLSTPEPTKTNIVPLLVQSKTDSASSPQIVNNPLLSGAVGVKYSATLAADNGVPPYTWGVAGGTLPTGISLQPRTGQIAGMPSQAGTFSFTVQVKDSSNQTASASFSANIAPAASPVITSISPASGPTTGGTSVTISGSNFQSGASVTFGAIAASSVVVSSSSQIVAVTPGHIAGSVALMVQENGQSSSSPANFTYNSLTPTVNAISPNNGPSSGGTPVTISGTNFLAGALVLFGTVPASNVTVVSTTQIQALTPANAAGLATVTVENSGNLSGVLSSGFTYTANTVPPANVSGLVNWTTAYQQIDGFGASTAWIPTVTSAQADLLWTTSSGIGLTYDREFIDCSSGLDGVSGTNTNALLASARGATVWLTPSAVPASMNSTGSCSNVSTLPTSQYSAYANYLKNIVSTLSSTYGIHAYALSVQNEPDQTPTYGSTTYTDQQLHDFIAVLGPALSGSGTLLMMPEPCCWDLLGSYDDTTMNDPSTASYVGILAAHDYDQASDPQNTFGKRIWETEVSDLNSLDTSIASGLTYAQEIHNLMTQSNINAWHYWSIAYISSKQTDNECLICNGVATKRLYTIGNFSKFVRPGYYRIDAPANPVDGVFVSAYKDPTSGNFAIVAINANGSATPLSLGFNGFSAPSLTPWVTSASLNLAQQAAIPAGTTFSATLPANSVTTFTGTAQ